MQDARTRSYLDPLDALWIGAAARIGFRVVRTREAYASTDGKRALLIGEKDTLDADDSLAALVLHELCHALVEGYDALDRPDWGLENDPSFLPREHACLRLQALLTRRHGLRRFFAPTTEYRAFWDSLGEDPLEGEAYDPSIVAAKQAAVRAARPPFSPHLDDALRRTREIGAMLEEAKAADAASLWSTVHEPAPPHPAGGVLAPKGTRVRAGATCGDCVWRTEARRVHRCHAHDGRRVEPMMAACERWEGALDCQECGACCREAFHAVSTSRRDPAIKRHPALFVLRDDGADIRRQGDRCVALEGDPRRRAPYTCQIYDTRPRTCREFTSGEVHCLTARRRVGLSF